MFKILAFAAKVIQGFAIMLMPTLIILMLVTACCLPFILWPDWYSENILNVYEV